MTSYVEIDTDITFAFDVKEILDAVLEQTLTQEKCPYEAQVNLLITDDEGIREFNRQFRQVDSPTDVLSFPQYENLEEIMSEPYLCLGDVIICPERAAEQAEEYGHSYEREMVYLMVHSIFHLLGYDHMNDDEKKVMREKEEAVMNEMGIVR